jgi:glycine betaine/proline transport system ATP-binding protein
MNPLGVLRARDVMGPLADLPASGEIGPDASMQEVMGRLKSGPLVVREGATTLGHVTADGVLAHLLDPRA